MKRTILFVIHSLDYGGAPKMLTAVANHLAIQGNKIYILTYQNNDIKQKVDEGIVHIKCKRTYKIRGLRRFLQIIDIIKTIRVIQPDVVISFSDYPNILSLLASKVSHVPVIISERGDPYARSKGLFHRFRIFMYQFADGIVFQTEGARDFYKKIIREKSIIIPNPVISANLPRRCQDERQNQIAFVGRFELITKRQDLMLGAFKKVLSSYPSIRLIFYGDGQDEDKIKVLVEEMDLMDNVVFAGVTENVYEAIRCSKLFVMSSDYEGIPNALIEAMSVGLPCVSTDCRPGGARLLIDHMMNGIIVPCGDIEALTNAIIFLLENDEIRERFGTEAMKIVEKFEPGRVLNMWNNYIEITICRRS